MDRDFLDLSAEKQVSPGEPTPLVPFPGNINTMDPYGLDSLWTPVSDMLGIDRRMFKPGAFGATDTIGITLALQCADVNARDLAKAEMALWREGQPGEYTRVRASEHWFARLLARRPNAFQTWTQFNRMIGIHLALAQNAYIVKGETRIGAVTELIPIQPARARPRIGRDNNIYYEIMVTTEFERAQLGLSPDFEGQTIILPARSVIHIKGRLWNGLTGMSNLDLGGPIFSLMKAIAAYQENLFGNNGQVLIAFETDQQFQGDMADASFRRLKEQLAERVRKGLAGSDPLLLEAGLTAKVIATNARESMTAEAFNALVMRVCGLMTTPPHKIMAYETVKYENMSAADNQYANDCLIPLAKNIEESLRFGLLTDDELDDLWPEYDRMALMAGDMKTLSDVLDKAAKQGMVAVNEYRERLPLSLNPIPGGNVRHVPVNTAMVDENGKIIAQTATGQNTGTGQDTGNDDTGDDAGQQRNRELRIVSSK